MQAELLKTVYMMNPWLKGDPDRKIQPVDYIPRVQTEQLLLPEWDGLWLLLVGPRQAGKTTLGKVIANTLIQKNRFKELLYLNCDFLEIRQWLHSPIFIQEALETLPLTHPILFIDEVQRLENPGLLLKGIADLQLPIKMMASGSSQLEIRSTIQEYLTGRHLEALVLPLSYQEIGKIDDLQVLYGCYPKVVLTRQKKVLLQQLYNQYIHKDIVEILKVGKPDVMQKLISLIAHSSGQLVNYNQLATDCRVSIPTIQHYCSILEKTYAISCLKPFIGNKRQEITSNPIYYFIDNGFRNQALRRFSPLEKREDLGLLIESAVFQEFLKYRTQFFGDFEIYYWRTLSGAEVDFILYQDHDRIIPVEVKYRNTLKPTITRALRSFIQAYEPKLAIVITKNLISQQSIENCGVHFIPFENLNRVFELIPTLFEL